MTTALPSVLLVDDEPHSLTSMRMTLEDDFEVFTASNASDARIILEQEWVHVVISDQRMPESTGVELLSEVRERWPEVVRIIVTGYTDTEAMAEAINAAGIHEFISKPWHPEQLLVSARNAAKMFQLNRDNERMSLEMRFLSSTAETALQKKRAALEAGLGFDTILRTVGSPMAAFIDRARQIASFDVPLLLTGEAGTCKGDLARAIHFASLRSEKPFYEVNCAGVDDTTLALELFGAKPGTLEGVRTNRQGAMRKADGSTLYLSGVEALSPDFQRRLARVLRDGAFTQMGAIEPTRTRLRLIVGANQALNERVAEGHFDTELFHMISTTELTVPPLRDRVADIVALASHLLSELSQTHGKRAAGFSNAAMEFFENYHWPGNQKQLENEVMRMLIFAQDEVLGADLISREILQADPGDTLDDPVTAACAMQGGTLRDRVEQVEARILRETLTRHKWNKSRAAEELGLSRVGLRSKLDRYGLAPPNEDPATDLAAE